jgi:hypothetical protein
MAQLINLLGGGIVQETTKKELKPIQMIKYSKEQEKRIIFTFITQQVKSGESVNDWIQKVAKDGFSHWDFHQLLKHIESYYIKFGKYTPENVQEVIEFEVIKQYLETNKKK